MAHKIHVISPVAGFGNALDLDIVVSLLEQNGFDVTSYPVRKRGKTQRSTQVLKRLISMRGRFDVNIFLAPIFPEWLPMARKNILVPNAEGFAEHLHKWLPQIDLVLAKTRQTERIFGELGCKTVYTSFTSRDQLDEAIPRDYTKFFHTCSSHLKGTKRLIEVWKAHPEWPELTVVINHNDTIPLEIGAANIRAHFRCLPDDELKQLQNSIGFHICCSEAEGFGHYIMEAMSCRAVTFSTNGPPMNELVLPSRGIQVDALTETSKLALARGYFFKPESLEEQIELARNLDPKTINRIGTAARTFFLENDAFFRKKFVELIKSL